MWEIHITGESGCEIDFVAAFCEMADPVLGDRGAAIGHKEKFHAVIIYTLPVNVRRSILTSMNKKRILIVEDNMDTYELERFILEKNGYDTFLAVNGRDGVDAVRKQSPDLIIMDLSMPEMDGWTATSLIKKDKLISNIPLIVVTAHALPGDRQRALDAGCNEYVTKPMDLLDLVDTVNLWVYKGALM